MKLIVGSRGSELALVQSRWVIAQIKKTRPDVDIEIKIIKTKGDKILDVALDKIGDKGLFVKEIESELIGGTIDFAVHSMKDMPGENPPELMFAKVPFREDNRDILVLRNGMTSLEELPQGAKIGTGSKRREFQIKELRPDIITVPIRGNVQTRIGKIEEMDLDGVILAAAGLHRLGIKDQISVYLKPEIFTPAPAQGALGIQVRKDNEAVIELLNSIGDDSVEVKVSAERSFLEYTNGTCHLPIGAYSVVDGDTITLTGLFGDEEGKKLVRLTRTGSINDPKALGKEVAECILKELK